MVNLSRVLDQEEMRAISYFNKRKNVLHSDNYYFVRRWLSSKVSVGGSFRGLFFFQKNDKCPISHDIPKISKKVQIKYFIIIAVFLSY